MSLLLHVCVWGGGFFIVITAEKFTYFYLHTYSSETDSLQTCLMFSLHIPWNPFSHVSEGCAHPSCSGASVDFSLCNSLEDEQFHVELVSHSPGGGGHHGSPRNEGAKEKPQDRAWMSDVFI